MRAQQAMNKNRKQFLQRAKSYLCLLILGDEWLYGQQARLVKAVLLRDAAEVPNVARGREAVRDQHRVLRARPQPAIAQDCGSSGKGATLGIQCSASHPVPATHFPYDSPAEPTNIGPKGLRMTMPAAGHGQNSRSEQQALTF